MPLEQCFFQILCHFYWTPQKCKSWILLLSVSYTHLTHNIHMSENLHLSVIIIFISELIFYLCVSWFNCVLQHLSAYSFQTDIYNLQEWRECFCHSSFWRFSHPSATPWRLWWYSMLGHSSRTRPISWPWFGYPFLKRIRSPGRCNR